MQQLIFLATVLFSAPGFCNSKVVETKAAAEQVAQSAENAQKPDQEEELLVEEEGASLNKDQQAQTVTQ